MSRPDPRFWESRAVCVTGGAGFLGQVVVGQLEELGARVRIVRSAEYDLRVAEQARASVEDQEIVLHLAARVGGIGFNRRNPGPLAYDNLTMGTNVFEQSRLAGVGKLVAACSVCAYPKHTPVPFREEELWNGYPEETNAPYGVAKKALLVMLQGYREQYGLTGAYLMPVNLYGPGDNFDLASSHVIPALIRKCEEARLSGSGHVDCWGTGSASREFLYVDDCAEAIVAAAERFDGAEPVNVGASSEITIRELTEVIARLVGFEGRLAWDRTKPDGQPRRSLDTSRARELFGFTATTDLEDGLRRTIDWYRDHGPGRASAAGRATVA